MTQYQLRILGAPDLRAPDGRRVTSVLSQPARLSLLAYLSLTSGPVTRASVVAAFWPERDEAQARNALSQAVFYLRRSLGKDAVQSVEGDRLWVPPERVWCDARELLTGDPTPEIMAAATDELLAGWNADGSQPLQEWLDGLRRKVRARATDLAMAEARPRVVAAGPAPASLRRRPLRVPAASAAGLVALLLLAVALARSQAPDAAQADGGSPSRMAVLQPRVIVSRGAPGLDGLTIYDELVARLPERAGLEVVSANYASSIGDLTKQLSAIGPSAPGGQIEDMPEWILDVSCIVADDAVRVVAVLYRGAGFGRAGRDSFDQPFAGPDDLVIDVPLTIAERVAEMVEDALGG